MAEYPRLHSIPGGRDGEPDSDTHVGDPAGARPVPPAPGRSARPESIFSEPAPDHSRTPGREPLWREVLGARLRELRREQGETLTETAGRAGISPQYLSEVERGRKEPSSEMIAALAGALGTSLGALTTDIAADLLSVARIAPVRPLRGGSPANPTMLARVA